MSIPAIPGRLRPMPAGTIIDEAIGLYRSHFRLFLTIGAAVLVPVGIFELLIVILLTTNDDPLLVFFAISINALVSGLGYVLLLSAMTIAASETIFERAPTAREAYDRVLARIGPAIGLALIYGLAIGGLSITVLGLPVAIYLAVAWVFCAQALLIEGRGVTASLGRSRDLIGGYWWRVIGIAILILIIQQVISTFFTLPALFFGAGTIFTDPTGDVPALVAVLDTLGSTVAEILTSPILFCTWVWLYYDLRVRKEGLDIELQAQRIGLIPAAPPSTESAP